MGFRVISYAVLATFLSLAWPLRGQFGHVHGALILGVLLVPALTLASPMSWRSAFGRALLLGTAGLSIGGTLGYAGIIARCLQASTLPEALGPLLQVTLIGAIWGGVGGTFLGYGFSERPLSMRSLIVAAAVGLLWTVLLGVLDKDAIALQALGLGLVAILVANALDLRSRIVGRFGLAGIVGIGGGFCIAVLLLWAGTHGYLGGGRWWNLRDQWIGAIGGIALAWAARSASGLDPDPNSWPIQAIAAWCQVVAVPLVNALDVYTYWSTQQQQAFPPPMLQRIAIGGLAYFATLGLGWAMVLPRLRERQGAIIRWGTFLSLWMLVALGIGKELIPIGWTRWELTYSLFVVEAVVLSLWLGSWKGAQHARRV